jgi:hypothetical protein
LREDQINQMQYSEGIDIVLSMDVSLEVCWRAILNPNRLQVDQTQLQPNL